MPSFLFPPFPLQSGRRWSSTFFGNLISSSFFCRLSASLYTHRTASLALQNSLRFDLMLQFALYLGCLFPLRPSTLLLPLCSDPAFNSAVRALYLYSILFARLRCRRFSLGPLPVGPLGFPCRSPRHPFAAVLVPIPGSSARGAPIPGFHPEQFSAPC